MALKDFVTARLSKPASRMLDAPIRDAIHEILREAGYASPAEMQTLRDELRDLRGQLGTVENRATEMSTQLAAARADADPRVATLVTTLAHLEQQINARLSALEARMGETPVVQALGESTAARLSTLEAQIAAFPTVVEQRLANIEARLTVLPAGLENRIEDLEARLEAPMASGSDNAFGGQNLDSVALEAASDMPGAVAEAYVAALAAVEAPGEPPMPVPLAPGPRLDCKVDGCDKPNRSKGFCSSHYQQWRRGTLKGFLSPEGSAMVDNRIVNGGADRAAMAYEVVGGHVYADGTLIG